MMRNPCPDDEYLIDFLEDRLTPTQRSQMEGHLAACASCREQVSVCARLMHDDSLSAVPSAPPALTRQAEAEVALLNTPRRTRRPLPDPRRWAARGRAVLEQFKFWGAPAPVAVRGKDAPMAEDPIQRRKQFGDLAVVIELEPHHGSRALVRVALDEKVEIAEPVRVAVIRDGRELASMMLGDAALVFEDIAPGIYTLVFVRRGDIAGEYTFELTDADAPHSQADRQD